MVGAVERGRRVRTLLERLGARVPGVSGYLERELYREADEALRHHLAAGLDGARREVAAAMASLSLAQAAQLDRLNGIHKELDALACRLRAAGSGYAGLFDAFKVREEQLAQLCELDLSLAEEVEAIGEATRRRAEGWESHVEELLERLRLAIDRRPQVVQGLLHQGGSS